MGFGWMEPFINKSPNIKIPNNVTDAEVSQSVQPLLATVSNANKPALSITKTPVIKTQNTMGNQNIPDLTDDQKILLSQIRNNPQIASATIHYKMAGLSTKRAIAAKQGLLSKGLIKEVILETGKRGAASSFLEVITKTGAGRPGGNLHNYLRNKAQDWYLSQNCKTEIEKNFSVNGQQKFVDMAVTWLDGKTEAVEIETEDTPRALENIRKNILLGFDVISVLTPNSKTREAIKEHMVNEIEKGYHSQICFPPISFYDKQLDLFSCFFTDRNEKQKNGKIKQFEGF